MFSINYFTWTLPFHFFSNLLWIYSSGYLFQGPILHYSNHFFKGFVLMYPSTYFSQPAFSNFFVDFFINYLPVNFFLMLSLQYLHLFIFFVVYFATFLFIHFSLRYLFDIFIKLLLTVLLPNFFQVICSFISIDRCFFTYLSKCFFKQFFSKTSIHLFFATISFWFSK